MPVQSNITLSQLQQHIRETLTAAFPGGVWVVAEIGEMKVNASSGHCYLELVEKGGDKGIPKARASATIWRHVYGMLSAYFTGATGADLRAGMKVLVKAAVTYHELYGLSLNISDIDPMYTLGDLERQRQETIEKLREDGVFDFNRELEMAPVPQRIALISSPNAAGYQDFINELKAGGYFFDVTLFESVMQGHGAEESIIGALSRISDDMERYDAVVIIRGGGSQSDLGFLNSYLLSFHVAQFPLPVIAGLGHDKDQSVLDMVAALSLKTPTAVAAYFIQKAAAFDADLEALEGELRILTENIFSGGYRMLDSMASALLRHSTAITYRMEMKLQALAGEIVRRQEAVTARRAARLDTMASMLRERSLSALEKTSMRIDAAHRIVAGRDPQRILALGFAIVRHNGKILRDASNMGIGDRLEITLHKGKITAKTE